MIMALGGGYFTSQNKVLPGSYIVFVSAANSAASISDRGVAAMGLELDWGPDNEIFRIDADDLQDDAQVLFGYPRDHEKLKGIRDIFKNATTLYAYKVNGGVKAQNTYAEAKCAGARGNSLKITIKANPDSEGSFDVQTVLDTTIVDQQTVKTSSELKDNDYVTWKPAELSAIAGAALTGGTNGEVTGESHQDFLDKIEGYSFNTLGCLSTDDEIKGMYCNFAKRMRKEVGSKFQVVVYNKAADYEGVVNLKNKTVDTGWPETSLIYWATGVNAGCMLGQSCTNKLYDGEFEIDADYTQSQLKKAIQAGEFAFHKVDDTVRVLTDINSLTSVTMEKGDVFKENTTIRVIDDIATSIARIFNTKYIGRVMNNKSGQVSLWSDIVKHHKELQDIGAIENFADSDVVVSNGKDRKSVTVSDVVQVTSAMEKLYMTCVIE